MIRKASIVALSALLGACATSAGDGPAPVTPTERYRLQAAPADDQIALAPHVEGLSAAQQSAVAALAGRFRTAGADVLTVRSAAGGGEAALKTAWNVKAALEQAGVPGGRVRLGAYDAAAEPAAAPVLVGFQVYAAVVPQCGRNWTDLTATRDNLSYAEFGCSVTANMAAQIADPRDLAAPQPMDPSDSGRRSVVLDAYRRGDTTSTKADSQAKGSLSKVVQ